MKQKGLFLLALWVTFGLAACAQHHTGEKVGAKLDRAEGKAASAIGKAAEKVGQKLNQAGEAIGKKLAPSSGQNSSN